MIKQKNQSWIPVRTSSSIQASNAHVEDDEAFVDAKFIRKLALEVDEIRRSTEETLKKVDELSNGR